MTSSRGTKLKLRSSSSNTYKTNPFIVTEAHLARYTDITTNALSSAKPKTPEGKRCIALAQQYVSDAAYFAKKGDRVRAFACLNYAHGWLDCAAMLELIEGPSSDIARWKKD